MADVIDVLDNWNEADAIAEIEHLRAEIKALRAQYDAGDDVPARDVDGTILCAVCGEASVRVKRRGSRWVCWGCWEEDRDGE